MIAGLLKFILAIVLIVGLAAFFFGYRWAGGDRTADVDRPVGTRGVVDDVDRSRARETGARIGESVAAGASQAQRAAADASVTAKIKAKMALDDTVRAADISVDTDGDIVTLRGTVTSAGERDRALQLARETEGVTSVIDELTVAAP